MSTDYLLPRTITSKMKENKEEAIHLKEEVAVKACRIRLTMTGVKKSSTSEVQKRDSYGYLSDEYNISDLPLKVKKHIITAGIIQGDIFLYGDGFASIKEVTESQGNLTSNKKLLLVLQALTPKSFEMAVKMVGILMDEVLELHKIVQKNLPAIRSWGRVISNEFDIQNLTKPTISHLITKGIIKGEIFHNSGAAVTVKGSPYLIRDLRIRTESYSERPMYLLIEGPDEKSVWRAVNGIKLLIKESEQIPINDGTSQVIPEQSVQQSNILAPRLLPEKTVSLPPTHKTTGPPTHKPATGPSTHKPATGPPKEVPVVDLTGEEEIDQSPQVVTNPSEDFRPFMPELGKGVEADVERCVVLVHWLLAHPLLVSFVICPPTSVEIRKFSKKMVITALLSLPLYDQYKCTHLLKKTCHNCYKFFSEAQNAVHQYCDAVVTSGYDITKLELVDNYIKNLSDNLSCNRQGFNNNQVQIGVLYDYPLPTNLYYLDNCRLFIDLVVNCGFQAEESHIESYLRSTSQWYPLEAFQKIVSFTRVKAHCPSKNSKTHHYPPYFSLDHHGGLINFQLGTIATASPGQFFPPDSQKIPKCSHFPFIKRLTVFSSPLNLKDSKQNFENNTNVPEKKTDQLSTSSVSISQAAYQMSRDWSDSGSALPPHGTLGGTASEQQPPPLTTSGLPPHASQSHLSSVNPFWNGKNLPENSQINPSGDSYSQGLEHYSQFAAQNTYSDSKIQSTISPHYFGSQKPAQETQNFQSSLPSTFSPTQEPSVTPHLSPNSSSTPGRVYRKKIRKEKKQLEAMIKEDKKEEVKKTQGTNSFWTVNHELETANVQGELATFVGTQTNPLNLHFGVNQPQLPSVQLLTGTGFPQNLQQSLRNMQLSMPTLLRPTVIMQQESKLILKPALLNPEQIVMGQPPKQGDLQLSQDYAQQDSFSEVISKLQDYIQATSTDLPTVDVREETKALSQPSLQQATSSAEQCTATGDSPFSNVIQQLQQYINSNNQTSTQDNFESKSLEEEQFKKPAEPIKYSKTKNVLQTSRDSVGQKQESSQLKHTYDGPTALVKQADTIPKPNQPSSAERSLTKQSKMSLFMDLKSQTSSEDNLGRTAPPGEQFKMTDTPIASKQGNKLQQNFWRNQESSQLKRAYNEPISVSAQPKRKCTENTISKPTKSAHDPIKITLETDWPNATLTQHPSPLKRGNLTEHFHISSVSILGDSLLQNARSLFGGSSDRDLRDDSFSISKLVNEVFKFYRRGGRLNPYCVVMCGVNDIINFRPKKYCENLKILMNFLLKKCSRVFFVTLPLVISESNAINMGIKVINGYIISYHNNKAKVSVLRLEKMKGIEKMSVLKSNHVGGHAGRVVLTDCACKLIGEFIEKEVRGLGV